MMTMRSAQCVVMGVLLIGGLILWQTHQKPSKEALEPIPETIAYKAYAGGDTFDVLYTGDLDERENPHGVGNMTIVDGLISYHLVGHFESGNFESGKLTCYEGEKLLYEANGYFTEEGLVNESQIHFYPEMACNRVIESGFFEGNQLQGIGRRSYYDETDTMLLKEEGLFEKGLLQ